MLSDPKASDSAVVDSGPKASDSAAVDSDSKASDSAAVGSGPEAGFIEAVEGGNLGRVGRMLSSAKVSQQCRNSALD